ncbi:putative RNA methyltransferase [Occallatibacter riparius]|uniref:putative RNA methyltransferase n=1 Tax=Occallatibacter riparius TaxID=1002689 RepID=UPI0036F21E97
MQLMTIRTLLCPLCRGEMQSQVAGVRCAAGHSFDFARQGYVNLVANMPHVRIR